MNRTLVVQVLESSQLAKLIGITWINIGYFYINKNNCDLIFDNDTFEDFLQQSANNGSINAFKHPGDHITVNTLSDLEEAQKNIKNIITE